MSIFFLGQQSNEGISVEVLRDLAAKNDFTIPNHQEEDYLKLLNATEAAVRHVNQLPEYIDPRLEPEIKGQVTRDYWKPATSDNPLNAWSHRCEAQSTTPLAKSGLLAGRTVAVKDNISFGHLPLTLGTFPQFLSSDHSFPISTIDAPVISRVLKEGGTIKGTATCENFSMCALSYSSAAGEVENPWLRGYTTGGSSSGCCALVAIYRVRAWRKERGLAIVTDFKEGVDMAIGGDQGGSIRLPAAYCGVYGLKPTYGLVPFTGIASLHPLIDHCGPIANSIRYIAILLSAISGYDGIDPRMSPETPLRQNVPDYAKLLDQMIENKKAKGEWKQAMAGKGLKIGLIKEAWEVPGLSTEVAKVVKKAGERFREVGAEVQEVSIPMHKEGPAIWSTATRTAMTDFSTRNMPLPLLSHPLPNFKPQPPTQEMYELLSRSNPAVINLILNSEYLKENSSPSVVAKAMMHAHQLRAAYDSALEEFDVLITPVNTTVGIRHPKEEDGVLDRIKLAIGTTANTCPFNVTGHPCLSLPVGWGMVSDGEDKLPIGMQIIGSRWKDQDVLNAAAIWEVSGFGLDNDSGIQ